MTDMTLRTPEQERALYNDLTVPEVARALRRSESTVRKLIRQGDLAATDVSTGSVPQYTVSEADLLAFKRERRTA